MYNLLKYTPVICKADKRGRVIKLLNFKKKKDKLIKEIYITTILRNKIKGWNMHTKNTTKIFLINGKINFFYFDKKKRNKIIDDKSSSIITIPPKVKFAFQGLAKESFILSMSNGVYDKKEIKKFEFN